MTSFTLHGVGVSSGYAIGEAQCISHALFEVSQYAVPETHIAAEQQRYAAAIETVKQELNEVHQQFLSHAPESLSGLMNTHILLLKDKLIAETPKTLIQTHGCNAEWAVKLQLDEVISQFDRIDDSYLRERKQDVIHVVERIIKVLMGLSNPFTIKPTANEDSAIEHPILVAHDISPADAIQFKQQHFAAFITDVGGTTSHTAILARSLNIPAIVALQSAQTLIQNGDQLIIDGEAGVIVINPSAEVLAEYQLRKEAWELAQQQLQRIKDTKPITLYGTHINLCGNIEVPEDVEAVKAAGGSGIGLFRTEFLFMNCAEFPDESTQFNAYRQVVESMQGLPVTIRTLDLGADKLGENGPKQSANPALGLRAIRYCLAEPGIFITQIRAILRASAFGKLKVLIPMLTTLSELRQTKKIIAQTKDFLREESIAFDEDIEIGGMIEIPAAALNAGALAQELDFLSIGTNDLIQYTLAIDRADDTVAHLYNPLHPSILKLIEIIIQACQTHQKSLSLCGEMAGDPKLTKLLIGMGLRELSMHPSHLLSVKQQVLHSEIKKLDKQAKKVLEHSDIAKIELLVEKMYQQ